MSRLGVATQGVCVNCNGTVEIKHKMRMPSFNPFNLIMPRLPGRVKGGVCRDCGALYDWLQAIELEPRPKFTMPWFAKAQPTKPMQDGSQRPERQSASQSTWQHGWDATKFFSSEKFHSPSTGRELVNRCAACHSQVPSDALYCPKCGEVLLDRCAACHAQVPDDAQSCPKCGVSLLSAKPAADYVGSSSPVPPARTAQPGAITSSLTSGSHNDTKADWSISMKRHLPWIITAILVITSWNLYLEPLFWLSLLGLPFAITYPLFVRKRLELQGKS